MDSLWTHLSLNHGRCQRGQQWHPSIPFFFRLKAKRLYELYNLGKSSENILKAHYLRGKQFHKDLPAEASPITAIS